MLACQARCSGFDSHRSLIMDKYLENIAKKYLKKIGFVSDHIEVLLDNLSEDNDILKHIFYNCRMFHGALCTECKYRFRCYTN